MKPLRTQTKLLVLMGLVICVFLCGLAFLYRFGEKQAGILLEEKMVEKVSFLNEFINLYEDPLQTYAFDYSFWDEMVSFVQTADSTWGYENVDVSLTTYHADAAWVYKVNGDRVYGAAGPEAEALLHDVDLESTFKASFNRRTFHHYFIYTTRGWLEIRIAPVQASSDNDRITPPQGYFVAGKLWTNEYIANLERAVQAEIRITKPGEIPPAAKAENGLSDGVMYFTHPLAGLDGQPIAILACEAESPLYGIFRKIDRSRMIYMGTFALGILLILMISLHKWVSLPLRYAMEGLQTGDQAALERLQKTGFEFERIGELVSEFAAQKTDLEAETGDRKRSEEELRASETRYRLVTEQTGQMIYDWDCVSGAIHWTGAIEKITGFTSEEYRHVNIDEWERMVHPDDRLTASNLLAEAAKSGGHYNVEYRLRQKEMSYTYVEDNGVFLLDEAGKSKRMLGTMKDISERRQGEEVRLLLQEKLERAQRYESLGLLAGGVAHDLNNMLGPIGGYAELLLRELSSDSKIAARVRKIIKSSEDAAAVIQDLLTLARRGRYEFHTIDLSQVVTRYLESPAFEKCHERFPNVQVRTDFSSEGSFIEGSDAHLLKVIMNLVTNAFEAMPEGGVISIRTEIARLGRLYSGFGPIADGDYAVLRIKDGGTGIAQEDLEKIFEPYFSKKQMGHSGSGLGLAVVYGIVKDHKGYYDVFSQPGEGTEFVMYFPLSEASVHSDEVLSDVVRGGTETVLVVDDSVEQRELAREIVAGLGYTVYAVENGHQAAGFVARNPVDILVLDMIMEPGFDGLDAYREISKIRPGQKAIVVSGFSETDRVREMQRLGTGSYLKKPYRVDDLGKALRKELDRKVPSR